MSAIFNNTANSMLIKQGGSGKLVASVYLYDPNGSGVPFTAPVVSIDELVHKQRQQLDCTLDGTVHILTAQGGAASCTITLLDRLPSGCPGNTLEVQSALKEYQNRRNKPGSRIEVSITSSDMQDDICVFTGVLTSCSATARLEKDTAYVIARYTMIGTWS